MTVAARLAELGISLPEPAKAVANYVPFVQTGNLVHISGQLSNDAAGGIKGTVGADVSPEQARDGARMCGDLERVVRVVKLGGFVQAAGDFEAIPAVINGCSDLMVEVFGDKGRHARSAVGVYKLPLGFAVEVDAIVEVR